jgi:cell division septation protein DedD
MKRAALVLLLSVVAITLGGCASTPTSEQLADNARLQNIPLQKLTPEQLTAEKARLQTLTKDELITEKLRSQQDLTLEQRRVETTRLQRLTHEQLVVENTPPQALTSKQLKAENTRLQERLIAEKLRLSQENADLSKDKTFLQTELQEAIRVPVTPQIVNQVRTHQGESELWDITYYTSVPVSLRSALNGGSNIKREPLQLSSKDKDTELTVLTYSEGGSSSSSVQIRKEDPGNLVDISSNDTVFNIRYQVSNMTDPLLLGFVLNPEKNWYELNYLGEERSPLDLTGDRPYLLINYQTIFSGAGEARTQIIDQSAGQAVASQEVPAETVWSSPAEDWDAYYPEEDYYAEDNGYYLDDYYEDEYLADLPVDDEALALVPAEPRPPQEVIVQGSGAAAAGGPPEAPRQQEAYQAANAPAGGNFFVLQVGAFQDKKHADAAYAALEREGFSPHYENYQDLTRVVIPAVEPKDLASTRERVKALGFGEPYIRQ